MRHRTLSNLLRGNARGFSTLTTVAAVAMLTAACDDGPQDCDQAGTTGSAAASSDDGTPPPPPGTTGGESADGSSSGAPPDETTGEPPDETTGEPPGTTGDETTDGGSSDGGSSTGEPVEEPPPPWMISVARVGVTNHLFQIDIDTGTNIDFCTVLNGNTLASFNDIVYSSTFTRDDRLMISTATALWEIELPTCHAFPMGSFGLSGVYSLAPDEANDLFAIDGFEDRLYRVDAQTGAMTEVGPIGYNWTAHGLTWNEDLQELVALEAGTDDLFTLDAVTGMATPFASLAYDFDQIALEYHSNTGQYYVCGQDSRMRRVEADNSLTLIVDLGQQDGCFNLAAPWSDMAGLPPLP